MRTRYSAQYFARRSRSEFKLKAMIMFLIAACVAWGIHIVGQAAFRSLHWVPYLIRTAITVTAIQLLLFISIRLLQQSGLPPEVLGLSPSRQTLPDVLLGVLMSVVPLAVMQALLCLFVQFHFTRGSLRVVDALKVGFSYLVGNSLEELMFRGLLLLVLSRLAGWRTAVAVIAFLFGLFHLQGGRISVDSWRIVTSTAVYSVLFSLCYLLTGSLWTATAAHVTSNVLLHGVLGLDGMGHALLVPVVSGSMARYYDLGFWALILGGIAGCWVLYFGVANRFRNATAVATASQRTALNMQ